MALLYPKKVKYRKQQKGRTKGVAQRGNTVEFGSYGLKSMQAKWVTSRQIEAARKVIVRYLRKSGKLWIRIFPDKPISRKGNEVPMGGGKGAVEFYVHPIKPGRIIFELTGIPEEKAREALRKAGDKLPVKTKFVKKS
jgi:large subunit ribosomal protein L16